MKTVGLIIKEARSAKNVSLEEVEKDTKIRLKFLAAIEADDFNKLPSVSYAKGFVKNYSEYLGLDSNMVLAFFRRQTLEGSKSSLLPKGVIDPLNRSLFQMTPSRFITLLVLSLIGIFLIYFGLQYRKLKNPPILTIQSPSQNMVIQERRIDILGKTDSDATVSINGGSVIVRSDGQFFDQKFLEPGLNKITITATSRYGQVNSQDRLVTFSQ